MSAVAEQIQTEMPAPILFTDSAAAKVADLIAEEGNPELKLRVFVQGGGCSGFQYGFTFDEVTNEDDTTMTKNGVSLLIDAMSYQYLLGAEIDYKEDLQFLVLDLRPANPAKRPPTGGFFSPLLSAGRRRPGSARPGHRSRRADCRSGAGCSAAPARQRRRPPPEAVAARVVPMTAPGCCPPEPAGAA